MKEKALEERKILENKSENNSEVIEENIENSDEKSDDKDLVKTSDDENKIQKSEKLK